MRETLSTAIAVLTPGQRRTAWRLLGVLCVGAVLETISVGAVPLLLGLMTAPDRVLALPGVRFAVELIGRPAPGHLLAFGAVGVLVLFVAKSLVLIACTQRRARFAASLQASLGERLFDAYLRSPYSFHLDTDSARLLRIVDGEVGQVVHGVVAPLLLIALELVTAVLVFVVLLLVEPEAALVAGVVLGGTTVLLLRRVRRRLSVWGARQQAARHRMTHAIHQGLWGVKDAQLLGRQRYFVERFRAAAEEHERSMVQERVVSDLPPRILELVSVIGLLMIGGALLLQDMAMELVVPTLALFAAGAFRLLPAFNRIAHAANTLRFSSPALVVVACDLRRWGVAAQPTPSTQAQVRGGASVGDPPKRDIEVEGVSYTYPNAAGPALTGVSFRVPVGAALAIVGTSGAGKTTLADVMLGLLEPDAGRIAVDGRDIRADMRAWQSCIGYVPQTVFLSDDTIRDNVAFGIAVDQIDEEAVARAIRAAGLEDLVAASPAGLGTLVGERGIRLSGGQRQRVAIARALYHDPSVLVLDEATSSLDVEMEQEVVRAIDALRGNRTLIVIAHRFASVRRCDHVVVLRGGRLIDAGPMAEVLQSSRELRAMATGHGLARG